MEKIRFEGRVAVVTGAGNGLGRCYAEQLAARGASVVVNDLGGDPSGRGASRSAADDVVAGIRATGGTATANYDSVATRAGGQAIIDCAMDTYGRIDIVINNAGILRNALFENLTDDQIDGVIDTHLKGLFYVSQPAYRLMQKQKYGRFVFSSSATGMFGNTYQANYGAAKGATTGLMQIVALEGEKYGIKANGIIPGAITRLGGDVDPELIAEGMRIGGPLMDRMKSENVAPIVLYLVSEQCAVNQTLYIASGGRFAMVFPGLTPGWLSPLDQQVTPEDVAAHISDIEDRTGYIRGRGTLDDLAMMRKMYDAALAAKK